MDVPDACLWNKRDWDPSYLRKIFSHDFYEFSELWSDKNIKDTELVKQVEMVEKYSPIVEDISLDDETLCTAVEKIEDELEFWILFIIL